MSEPTSPTRTPSAQSDVATWLTRHRLFAIALCLVLAGVGGLVWIHATPRALHATPPGGACGTLHHDLTSFTFPPGSTTRADIRAPITECLWQAFQVCVPATLTTLEGGVDTSHQEVLTIAGHQQPCAIGVESNHWDDGITTTASFRCTSLSRQAGRLLVAGCEQGRTLTLDPDVFGPLCNPSQAPPPGPSPLTPAEASCFLQAEQSCYARRVVAAHPEDDTLDHVFWIDNRCGISTMGANPFVIASCAALTQKEDGLHFLKCGPFGDLFIPVLAGSSTWANAGNRAFTATKHWRIPMDDVIFDLEVQPASGDGYPVVAHFQAGSGRAVMRFPCDAPALENALLRSAAVRRQVLTPEAQAVQDFGHQVLTAQQTGVMLQPYDASGTLAGQQRKGLRVRLQILIPEPAALLWVYRYDPRLGDYQCFLPGWPLVRLRTRVPLS